MGWIVPAFLIVSMLHMTEEYFYPGGFMDVMKHVNPALAPFIDVPMAIIVNGLQLILCVAAIFVGSRAPIFTLSITGLLLTNAVVHIGACFRLRGYSPGILSGVLLYIPIAIIAYTQSLQSGLLTSRQVVYTIGMGLIYQAVPIIYLLAARLLKRA